VRRLLSLLWNGQALRHLPIALPESPTPPVRLELHRASSPPRDVSDAHVPVSMRPLILGVRTARASDGENEEECSLVVTDRATEQRLGEIRLAPAGSVPLGDGRLALFRTTSCRNTTAPALTRWWRYALSWEHARRAPARGDGLRMSASDLRCLNVYYMWPRPVYLIGVAAGDRSNLFPMDLVGRVDASHFLLALRATSPAIALMETSRVIAMSAAPADQLRTVYALGAHHRKESVDTSALPFPLVRSARHGLPVLSTGFTRELSVREVHRIGSHVLFVCRVDAEQGVAPRQLAHISFMYAEWLARQGRPQEPAERGQTP
jgi:flavin reductase (DIM6/NTAB) family NADH-FMN oxidoreductase RutF